MNIIANSNALRTEIIDRALAFSKHAAGRTVDVVPDIKVLTMQLLCWNELSEEQKQVQFVDPQAAEEQ